MAKAKFTGGKKVEVDADGFIIKSDFPKSFGGEGKYPSPMELLQGALLACASMHVMTFMEKINIDLTKVTTELEPVFNEDGYIVEATILIYVPAEFPAEREKALIGAGKNCPIGRHVTVPKDVVVVKQ
jgi:uncharacterized OsmC-like protein